MNINNSPVIKDYIAEFVYGGIDGSITTFAVVAGAAGANAGSSWVIIFGLANLIADGFSMSVGNYFSTKATRDNYEKYKAKEYWRVENTREKEEQEITQIYEAKGFKGDLLKKVVDVIISDKNVWVETMMKEELKMNVDPKTPVRTALATFLAFNIIGIIPLLSYVIASIFNLDKTNLFLISCVSTGIGLMLIGYLKSIVTNTKLAKGVLETLIIGSLAATIAFYVGHILSNSL